MEETDTIGMLRHVINNVLLERNRRHANLRSLSQWEVLLLG